MKFAVISKEKPEYSISGAEIDYIESETAVTEKDWSNYDAVFLVKPYSQNDVKAWTGHSHLRVCSSVSDLESEIASFTSNLEIERKFLIEMPDISLLEKYYPYAAQFEQIYLEDDALGTRRIRKRETKNQTQFFETLKVRISGSTCNEYEQTLSEEEYNKLKLKADKNKHPINKTRYCFVYLNKYFELDIYDFWKDRATLEAELKNENDEVILPPELKVIKDVTDDYYYKNKHLAGIDYEDY